MFDITLGKPIEKGNVTLTQDDNLIRMTVGDDRYYYRDDLRYINMFCKRLKTFQYESVLILGLGLGVIPYYMEKYKNITNIDVIEPNNNIIEITSSLNHLKHTKIYKHDYYNYKTDKKYDLILVDIWWNIPKYKNSEIFGIESHYKKNQNGIIYFPLFDVVKSI